MPLDAFYCPDKAWEDFNWEQLVTLFIHIMRDMISRPNGRKLERAQGCGGPEDSLPRSGVAGPDQEQIQIFILD